MADEVKIDKALFHDRLLHFVTQWKADKRSGDALFQGAGALVIPVGKASESNGYSKSSAFQVSDGYARMQSMDTDCSFPSFGYSAMSFPRHL
jgi:hypothetical protein